MEPMSNSIIAQQSTRLLPREWDEEGAGGAPGDDYTAVLIGAEGAGILSGSPTNSQKTSSPYLECGANHMEANRCDWLEVNCHNNYDAFFIPGHCENHHQLGKKIVCGKEWCPVCGKHGSTAHGRRMVRLLDKIQTFKRMRYGVFTIPQGLRPYFRTKESLKLLRTRTRELLKKQGFDRGVMRYHYFGDKSQKYHPHLNVMFPGGYLNSATLQAIKDGYRKVLEKITGVSVEKVSVNVQYRSTPRKMVHTLQYVTRATFLDYEWDVEMAMEIRGFKNVNYWGKWEGLEKAWEMSEREYKDATGEKVDLRLVKAIIDKKCPVCGLPLIWEKALPAGLLELVDKKPLGLGYYLVSPGHAPPMVNSVAIKCRFMAGQHGIEGDRWRYYLDEKVKGHEDEIREYQLDKELSRRSRSRYNKYLDDLAWLQVAADMSAAERKGNNAI